jgi:two-component system nitrogen regulation sensor histidine kinase NtrY
LGRLTPWLALVSLWTWSGGATVWALFAAAVLLVVGALLQRGSEQPSRAWGLGLVTAGILVGFHAERQVAFVTDDWDRYWAERVDRVGDLLSGELDRRQLAGGGAADALIQRASASGASLDPSSVAEIRDRYGASALALYDGEGRLVAWDGTHRGKVPESVQRGQRRESYRDLPLFGYLYVTSAGPDGSVAAAAYLLRASLPEGLGADMNDLATNFFRDTGERIRITEEDPGFADAVWDLELDDDRLLSVVLEQPTRVERSATVRARWAVVVFGLAAAAWLLLALGGTEGRREAALAAVALVVGAVCVPLPSTGAFSTLLDPALFSVARRPLPIGRAALAVIAAHALLPWLPRPDVRLHPALAGLLTAALYPLSLLALHRSVTMDVLIGGRPEWVAYQIVATGILSAIAGLLLSMSRAASPRPVAPWGAVLLAVGLSGVLGVAGAWYGHISVWWAAAWGAALALGAAGLDAWRGWRRPAATWGLAVVLGSTAAIPTLWVQAIEGRILRGQERLERIRAVEDPEVEARLRAFAAVADSLDMLGAEDVTILYESWRLSGLSGQGHPVRLQMEGRDGSPGAGLRVAAAEGEPQPYQSVVAEGRRTGGTHIVRLDEHDARYIATVALRAGRMLVAVVPPFPERSGRAGVGPLVRGTGVEEFEALTVLPVPAGQAVADSVARTRTAEGWRLDAGLSFSNGARYHARYAVELPQIPVRLARASLLVALNLTLLLAALVGGRLVRADPGRDSFRLRAVPISFRARVTLALFGFFALANAVFGTLAFRTLDQASRRSAQVLAERVVEDAVGWYQAFGGQMARLADQVGAELLEYREGALRDGSVVELVDLGLYEGWTPYELHRSLDGYSAVREFRQTSLGRWEYGTAYRRLRDGNVLAAQVPLQAGTTALQTTDLLELLAFVVLLGAGLSLGLAMIAGRALTRPIHALQIASEGVGAGDLTLRLPADRQDEFGAVFRAFNRMVSRVRRARRQLVRTSRRTQLIMDEAAVGMVALDPTGRVMLVNPRAEELLGLPVAIGSVLPRSDELGEALTRWLADYLAGHDDDASSDIQAGERRLRVRARMLGTTGSRRGVVVALDDVTDELRAERVLAWGEMARQVAHEVKNPLTPIKLSIQHVRRAWDDGHPRFGDILIKNADAMLLEIDRLADIAQSFSRFGAPGDQMAPLAPVALEDVVGDVMTLYGSGAARVRFEAELEPGLPPVVARDAELKEVLVNLLENARVAGEDGTLIVIRGHRSQEGWVELAVADNGSGIPPEVLPRIFEPQFSTRSKGTGLGLAIVQRVVRAWGGTVSVASEVGEGTTVTVGLRAWPDGGADARPPG